MPNPLLLIHLLFLLLGINSVERKKSENQLLKVLFSNDSLPCFGICGEYRLAADEPLIKPGYLAALLSDG